MIEGRGAPGPVPVNLHTFNSLLRACHQKAMIEKALEVMSWMISSGLQLDMGSYDEIIHCAEVAQLWDKKAMKHVLKVKSFVAVFSICSMQGHIALALRLSDW